MREIQGQTKIFSTRRGDYFDDNNFVLDVVECSSVNIDQQGLGDIQVDTCSEEVLDFLLNKKTTVWFLWI